MERPRVGHCPSIMAVIPAVVLAVALTVTGCAVSHVAPTNGTVAGLVTAGGGPVTNHGGPVSNGLLWFYNGSGRIVRTARTDRSGNYSVVLAPGVYSVAGTPCIAGRYAVTVRAGQRSKLNLVCSML